MKFPKLCTVIFVFIMLISLTIGCASQSSTTTTQAFQIPSNYTTYTDESSLFSVSYPNQWEPVPDTALAAAMAQTKDTINAIKSGLPIEKASILFAAGLKKPTGYYPSVNIVVEPSPTGVSSSEEAVQAELLGLKQIDPKYQEVSRTKVVVNGKDAIIVEYKAHFSTSPLMHNLVLACLSSKTIWVLTCTATDTDFSQWSNDFNNIARSFKINK